jgi:ABC-type phosphate transport system permease subunit
MTFFLQCRKKATTRSLDEILIVPTVIFGLLAMCFTLLTLEGIFCHMIGDLGDYTHYIFNFLDAI